MFHAERGMTLLELMIVVAVIGILAAIAIPAYNDYSIRAKILEGIVLAAARTSVTEFRYMNNRWPSTNAAAWLSSTVSSKSIKPGAGMGAVGGIAVSCPPATGVCVGGIGAENGETGSAGVVAINSDAQAVGMGVC